MPRQDSYKVQTGCHNCRFRIEDTPEDDGSYWYCNLEGLMDTHTFYTPTHKLSAKKYDWIRKWMFDNEVDASGICDKWEKIDGKS